MGNRAVIAIGDKASALGIYLHWNGGPESVLAFLDAARDCGVRDPLQDSYGAARLCQIIGNFFGGTNSVGIDLVKHCDTDNGDNGTYILGPNFTVKARKFSHCKVLTAGELEPDDRIKYDSIKAQCLQQLATNRGATP